MLQKPLGLKRSLKINLFNGDGIKTATVSCGSSGVGLVSQEHHGSVDVSGGDDLQPVASGQTRSLQAHQPEQDGSGETEPAPEDVWTAPPHRTDLRSPERRRTLAATRGLGRASEPVSHLLMGLVDERSVGPNLLRAWKPTCFSSRSLHLDVPAAALTSACER